MKKAHDTGCLCIECEGMNELRRGSNAVVAQLDAIMKRIEHARNATITSQLDRMKNIISMLSKYESILTAFALVFPVMASLKLLGIPASMGASVLDEDLLSYGQSTYVKSC